MATEYIGHRLMMSAPDGTFEHHFLHQLRPKLATRCGAATITTLQRDVSRFAKWRGRPTPIKELSESLVIEFEAWLIDQGVSGTVVQSVGEKVRYLIRMIDADLCRKRFLRTYKPKPVRIAGIGSKRLTVSQYCAERYIVTRSLAKTSEYQVLRACEIFENWLSRESIVPDVRTVDELLLSKWVRWLELMYSPHTARKLRGDVLGVLADAADSGLRAYIRPRRVRRPVVPKPIAKAWDRQTCERIILACRKLQGKLAGGVPRALYFECIYRAAWRLAIRKGDLMALRMSDIQSDGRVFLCQRKTRTLTSGRLGPVEVKLLRSIGREQPLKWPHAPKLFYEYSHKVKAIAGVDEPGHLHRFRKSSATDVARRNRADATKILGHASQWADPYYIDPTLLNDKPVEPSRLRLPGKAVAR